MCAEPNIPFYVRVDCEAYSRHRDPKGVYQVVVVEEQSIVHCAAAALQIIKDQVAFIDENSNTLKLRAFTQDGNEIRIPGRINARHHDHGSFKGRAVGYPEIITLQ